MIGLEDPLKRTELELSKADIETNAQSPTLMHIDILICKRWENCA